MSEFEEKLRHAINYCSKENGSNTPDFVLAAYLTGCLDVFDRAMNSRDEWRGVDSSISYTPAADV